MHPIAILGLAMAFVIAAIVVVRLNAFVALLSGALLVSLLAPGDAGVKVTRVAEGFGRTAGAIGIVIALAAIIGAAMMESGAADRIVNAFLGVLGEKRASTALGGTGFVLSIPVFFDTVFYLLVPLARSMHARTGTHYLRYLVAIAGCAAATHTLVPPTPGPLAVATALGVDLGTMVLMGLVVAAPAAAAALAYARWIDRRIPLTPPVAPAAATAAARPLPGLADAMAPIALPVLLISAHTVAVAASAGRPDSVWAGALPYTATLGNPNMALLLAMAWALWTYVRRTGASRDDVARLAESALASAGIIILVTAAGGAFGAALQAAQIGPAIQRSFSWSGAGFAILILAFGVSSLVKIAQGSSTVAMITTAGMIAAVLAEHPLPFHAVYVATAIASGSLVGTWMNDSGFWVFSKMGGVSEVDALKSWTVVAAIVGVTAMATTLALASLLPLR